MLNNAARRKSQIAAKSPPPKKVRVVLPSMREAKRLSLNSRSDPVRLRFKSTSSTVEAIELTEEQEGELPGMGIRRVATRSVLSVSERFEVVHGEREGRAVCI